MSNDDRASKLEAAVQKRMGQLNDIRTPMPTRVKIARWLGEIGAIQSISVLSRVYETEQAKSRGQQNKDLLEAVTYALGQFQALRDELAPAPDETVDEALVREENAATYNRLIDLQTTGKTASRKSTSGRALWRLATVLTVSLIALIGINVVMMGSDDTAASEIIEATEEPDPPTATLPPNVTPSATPTPSITPTPTVDPVLGEPYVRELTNVLTTITESRGPVELLRQYWRDAQTTNNISACNDPVPAIPDAVVVPDDLQNTIPGLRDATTQVNTALSLLRDGWQVFAEACEAGNLIDQSSLGIELMNTVDLAIEGARVQLLDLQQRVQ
jgi:hypothetical protein